MKKVIEYISVAFFFKLNFETCDTAPTLPPPKKKGKKKSLLVCICRVLKAIS